MRCLQTRQVKFHLLSFLYRVNEFGLEHLPYGIHELINILVKTIEQFQVFTDWDLHLKTDVLLAGVLVSDFHDRHNSFEFCEISQFVLLKIQELPMSAQTLP